MEDVNQMLTPDAVVIYPSRGKLLLVVLGAGAFVALGLLAWRTGQIAGQIEGRVVAVLGVGFFGVCLAYALVRLIRRTPSLIIKYV